MPETVPSVPSRRYRFDLGETMVWRLDIRRCGAAPICTEISLAEENEIVRLLVSKRPSIIAYAMSIVANQDLAEEIYQNVVVVVLRKRETIDESRDVMRWILGVTRVEALVALRQRGRTPHVFSEETLELLDVSWRERFDDRGSATDNAELLRGCIKKLSDRSQEVLRLRYIEGISGEKLAEQLGVKLNTAYVSVARIHRQLRSCIERRRNIGASS